MEKINWQDSHGNAPGYEQKHTPTPWMTNITGIIFGADGHEIAKVPVFEEANAAVIVRAVNSHEALIQRLNGLIATLESVRANYDKPEKALNGSWYSFDHMISDEISRTRKAIAQAEGK